MIYRTLETILSALLALCILGFTVAHWAEMGAAARLTCLAMLAIPVCMLILDLRASEED